MEKNKFIYETTSYKISNMTILKDIGLLLFQPQKFFAKLKQDNSYKRHVFYFLVISLIFYLIWFINIWFDIQNEYNLEDETVWFRYMFGSFNQRFIYYTSIFIVVDVIAVFIAMTIVSLIAKLICLIFRINLTLKEFWKITVYSSSPVLFSFIIQIIFLLNGYDTIPFYVEQIPGLYTIVLFIIGVKSFNKIKT